jgi:hypothetical protein
VLGAYSEAGGGGLETGEVSGEDTGLVELTRAHEAVRTRSSAYCTRGNGVDESVHCGPLRPVEVRGRGYENMLRAMSG